MEIMSLPRTLANRLILAWICILPATAQQTTQEEKQVFGGDYEQLEPEQKKVVDDWFRRFNEIAEQHLKSEEGYNRISTSVKTTFDAVTHALYEFRDVGDDDAGDRRVDLGDHDAGAVLIGITQAGGGQQP